MGGGSKREMARDQGGVRQNKVGTSSQTRFSPSRVLMTHLTHEPETRESMTNSSVLSVTFWTVVVRREAVFLAVQGPLLISSECTCDLQKTFIRHVFHRTAKKFSM